MGSISTSPIYVTDLTRPDSFFLGGRLGGGGNSEKLETN